MRFAHPLGLLALVALPCVWWIAARAGTRAAAPRRVVWRTTTAALLVLGASGTAIVTGRAPIVAVVALDRSASVPTGAHRLALERANAFFGTMQTGDRLGLVSFGADAAVDVRPAAGARRLTVQTTVAHSRTDIGRALRVARSMLPDTGDRRIVLISDGHDNAETAAREVANTAAAGVAIDVLVPAITSERMRVTRMTAPADAAVGQPYVVTAEVVGAPSARGTLLWSRDDQPLGARGVVIGASGSASVQLTERQDDAGVHVYRAALESDVVDSTSASAGAVVVVTGIPAILYVATGNRSLAPALADAGYAVRHVPPEEVPQQVSALSPFAAVVLDDVPADRVTRGALGSLAAYVEDAGGGLLVLGSPRTLTLDGFPATALERVLPVDVRPRAGQRAPAVDLVLVFDKSGSMSDVTDGVPKIEVARQAVLGAADIMPPGNAIGVVAFDSSPTVVTPLGGTPDTAALRARLRAVVAGGSTAIAPAVATALQWLQDPGRPPAARRLILLVSDGRTSEEDASRLRGLVREGGVELSAVAIGSNANRSLLEELAASTGGRAYFPDTLHDLPRAVAREAARSAAGGVVQEPFVARGTGHPVLTGLDLTKLPALNGYVVTAAKPTAHAVLVSHLDDPVLCAWRAGLGRVAVFTADLRSSWSLPLRGWREGDRFWTQTVRWLGRRAADDSIHVRLLDTVRGARLEVQLAERGEATAETVTAIARSPGAPPVELVLEPGAPGLYEADLPAAGTGSYIVTVTARQELTGAESHVVRALYWSADRERRTQGVDAAFLSRAAMLTGGRILGGDESPFDAPRSFGYRDVSAWLIGAALMMFVWDIAGLDAAMEHIRRWRRRQGIGERGRAA